jgi:hypothetical protein
MTSYAGLSSLLFIYFETSTSGVLKTDLIRGWQHTQAVIKEALRIHPSVGLLLVGNSFQNRLLSALSQDDPEVSPIPSDLN